jgi:RNA polymerase sigma-70 factor (ECF subfamily)
MRAEPGQNSGTPIVSVDELNTAIVVAYPDLLRRSLYLTRDRDQARDLVHRTIERACASRRQLRPGSNPAHWLGAILTSQFIDELRRLRAGPFSRSVGCDNIAATPGDPCPVWNWLGIEDVVAATAKLPPHFREPFEMYALRGHSQRVVALRLGLPEGTIATRVFRAKRLLKQILMPLALRGSARTPIPIRGRASTNQRAGLRVQRRILGTSPSSTVLRPTRAAARMASSQA